MLPYDGSMMGPDSAQMPPPGLEELLAGGGPAAGAAPADLPSGPPDAPSGSPEDLLRTILELATEYRDVETDEQDRLKIEKVTTLVQQILADRQAASDNAIGGGNLRTLRRLAGG